MKSKVLIGALAVLLAIGMVSCSMDEYAKLGEAMGKMGSNVYGIEPNMQEVTATVSKLDGSVSDDGMVTLPKSSELVDSLAEIKNSSQKMEEIKKQLDAPVAEDKETAKKVQASLTKTMEDIIKDTEVEKDVLAKAGEKVQSAYESVTKALNDIKDNISDNPTKADLATVAIVNDLAETVKDIAANSDKYKTDGEFDTSKVLDDANKALKALDALKVTSKFTDGVLDGLSLSSLLSSASSENESGGKAISKAVDEESNDFEKMMETAVTNIANLTKGSDGKFNEAKYKSLMLQLNAFRTAYEATAWLVSPEHVASLKDVDKLLYVKSISGIGNKLSTNDAMLYAVSFIFTESNSLFGVKFMKAVESYVNGGENEDLFDGLSNGVPFDDAKINALENRVVTAANTAAVILINADFDLESIAKLMSDGKSFGEILQESFDDLVKDLKETN